MAKVFKKKQSTPIEPTAPSKKLTEMSDEEYAAWEAAQPDFSGATVTRNAQGRIMQINSNNDYVPSEVTDDYQDPGLSRKQERQTAAAFRTERRFNRELANTPISGEGTPEDVYASVFMPYSKEQDVNNRKLNITPEGVNNPDLSGLPWAQDLMPGNERELAEISDALAGASPYFTPEYIAEMERQSWANRKITPGKQNADTRVADEFYANAEVGTFDPITGQRVNFVNYNGKQMAVPVNENWQRPKIDVNTGKPIVEVVDANGNPVVVNRNRTAFTRSNIATPNPTTSTQTNTNTVNTPSQNGNDIALSYQGTNYTFEDINKLNKINPNDPIVQLFNYKNSQSSEPVGQKQNKPTATAWRRNIGKKGKLNLANNEWYSAFNI